MTNWDFKPADLIELVPCSEATRANLGQANYAALDAFAGIAEPPYTVPGAAWMLLAQLSAYAAAGSPQARRQLGSVYGNTPRLEPFMFINPGETLSSRPVEKVPLRPSERRHSYVAMDGLYAYMEQAANIRQYRMGVKTLNFVIGFTNHRVEETARTF
jgi:hypothetical protein